ncbi:MAG: HlyD family efflux transporter periplasmic adaptor subunit [Phycisphaerales bacterium]
MTVNNNKGNGTSRKPVKLIGAAIVVAAVVFAVVWLRVVRAEDDPTATMATFIAKRGPLTISVLEAGAIKAKEQEIIRNEVEGRTTIVQIVPEGTHVKVGDLLVKLDASTMDDEKIDQEIKVQNADASFVDANEALAIAINQAKSDIEKAELTLKFAKEDLRIYNERQYLNDEIAASNKVDEANEVLTRAKETRKWSETLYQEKYLSQTELLADRLAVTKGENSLTVANNDLKLLQQYTKNRKVEQYASDVNQAEMALERTKRKASANVVQAQAGRSAKEQEWKRQKDKLAKLLSQIDKATVYSPAEGMVVYATSSRGGFGRDDRKPLADGVEVWERQELIYIPKSSSSVAEVDVHEASLDKVRAGLPAVVTVDALPGKKFIGTVSRIAPLPNAQSMWMNPDLKVYTTNIDLESPDPALRSGMSCKADIIVEQYKDVVYIPVQCVLRIGGQPTVHIVKDGKVEKRNVEIGLDDDINIAVLSGLSEGEVVLLTPPLQAATLTPGERIPGGGDANDATTQRINEKLRAANEMPSVPAMPTGGGMPTGGAGQSAVPGAGGPGQGPSGGQGFQMPSAEQIQRFQNMSQEERQKMMEERLKSMTPEQRQQAEQMRQRFQNMTPEEREQMRQQRRGNRGEGGAGSGDRGDGSGRGQGGDRGGAGSGQPQGGQ